MPQQIELYQGTSQDFPFQISNNDGSPAQNIFVNSNTLTCQVWAGQDQPVILTPSVIWFDNGQSIGTGATNGQVLVSFNNSDTTTLLPGIYRLIVEVTISSRTIVVVSATLKLLYVPGSAPTLPVYCTLTDMLRWNRWIQDLNIYQTDETGFLTQRNEARQWLDNVIQRHYRLTAGLNLTTFGNPVPTWGPRRTGGYSQWLQSQLDAGPAQPTSGPSIEPNGTTPIVSGLSQGLMINEPRRVKELTSKYATFLVLQDVVAGSGQSDNWYATKASWLLDECEALVKGYTAEINPTNGYPAITVECALIDVLRGG